MKRIIIYGLFFLLAFTQACKKIDVEPQEGVPVFSADFAVDGGGVNMEGGVDEYYMFTSFEKDGNDVYSFIGELKKENCDNDCGESLKIIIRDIEQRPVGNPDVNEAIAEGNYNYYSEILELGTSATTYDTAYSTQIVVEANLVGGNPASTTYQWSTNTGNTATGFQAVFDSIDLALTNEVTLSVVELISASGICTSTSTQKIIDDNQPHCSVSILPEGSDSMLLGLKAVPAGTNGAVSYVWSNGSQGESFAGNLIPGTYGVTITDAGGCESEASYTYTNADEPGMCQAIFNYSVETTTEIDSMVTQVPGDSLQFSRVTIVYTSKDGDEYVSDKFDQANDSFFQIINVEDFDENEEGFPTKKIMLRFKCTLWDGSGLSKNIESSEDVIWGVAYPN